MGEYFGFDDARQMRRRLPRLSALCPRNNSARPELVILHYLQIANRDTGSSTELSARIAHVLEC
jgi:hypothetical protein